MTWVVHLTALLAVVGYLSATVLVARSLTGKAPAATRLIRLISVPALALHLTNVALQVFTPDGIQLGVIASASLFGLVMALSSSVMALYRRTEALLAPSYALTALALSFSIVATDHHATISHLPAGIVAHIVLSIIAYTLVMLAGSQALLIKVQNRHLKHRNVHRLLKLLPPLQTMEAVLFDLVVVGWVVLTLAIVAGFMYVDNMLAQHLVHKTFFTLAAWVVFGTLLIGRSRWGWRGETAVRWTLSGLLLLVTGYFGTQVILQFILTR